jgi:hypothetical protein
MNGYHNYSEQVAALAAVALSTKQAAEALADFCKQLSVATDNLCQAVAQAKSASKREQ